MKILVSQFLQEGNSFSPIIFNLKNFKDSYYAYGKELFKEIENKGTELGGALDLLTQEGADIVPSVAMQACSGGPVEREVYEHFKQILFKDIDKNKSIDGIYLCLHGSTVFTDEEDGVGRLLEDVRQKVGDNVIISISLDYHANVTKKMIENVNIIRGYHTYPHMDLYETGYDAARMLVDTIKGFIKPQIIGYKIPMIVQSERTQTTKGAMAELAKMAREAEKEEEIISISYFQVQPWLDVKDIGCTIIVIGDDKIEKAQEYGSKLATFFWDKKETFKVTLPTFDDVLNMAERTEDVIVFSDPADSTSSGSPGDSNVILKEYLKKNVTHKTYMLLVDPETVEEAIEAGVGNTKEFNIGGKIYTELYSPVKVLGKVKIITSGDFIMEGDYAKGKTFNMGKAVVIQKDNLYILVTEKQIAFNDPGPYLSVGLDPAKAKLVMVKSPNQYKSVFNRYTDKLIDINAPGASASYFWELPYKNLGRPIYPFDNINYVPQVYAKGKRLGEDR